MQLKLPFFTTFQSIMIMMMMEFKPYFLYYNIFLKQITYKVKRYAALRIKFYLFFGLYFVYLLLSYYLSSSSSSSLSSTSSFNCLFNCVKFTAYAIVQDPTVCPLSLRLSTQCNFDPSKSSMSPFDLPNNHPDRIIPRGQQTSS